MIPPSKKPENPEEFAEIHAQLILWYTRHRYPNFLREESLQKAAEALQAARERGIKIENPLAYAKECARRVVWGLRRRAEYSRRVNLTSDELASVSQPSVPPEAESIKAEEKQGILEAFESLPEDRQLILSSWMATNSVRKAGALLNMPHATFHREFVKALQELLSKLRSQG